MASWYERVILPRLVRMGCGCAALGQQRQRLIPLAEGRVLELGMGAGANLSFYDPARIEKLIGAEPSPELRNFALAAPGAAALPLDIQLCRGEELPFDSGVFDTVVCTFTLCSVNDVSRVLSEARRVLRPGGTFLFCEHGRADDPGIAKWQSRLEPIWKRVFGNCHLTRQIGHAVGDHFQIETLQKGFQPDVPRLAGWIETGRARAA